MACEVKSLVLEGLAPKTFPKRSYGKVLGEPRSEPPRNPATSGSIDHGAMHRWHHTVASLILGQLGDRVVCVKQCRYQRGEDESLSHPQTGASTATPRRSMSRRGAQPGSRPPRPALQRSHAGPGGGFLVLRPRGVDPVLRVPEVVSRSGTPPDSQGEHVRRTASTACPTTPRNHRSRPGSAAGRMASVAHGVPARTKYFSSAARHRCCRDVSLHDRPQVVDLVEARLRRAAGIGRRADGASWMGPRLGTKRPRQRRSALPGRGELVRTNGARRDTGRRDNDSARGPSHGTGAPPHAGKDWRSRDRTAQRPICPTSHGRGGACPEPAAWPGRKLAPTTYALFSPRISDPIPDVGQETRNLVISEW